MADWDPALYERFRTERSAPFYDLMGLLRPPEPGLRIVDLGCGTGELTALIASAFADCEVVGIDNSASMLAQAAPRATEHLRFELDDLASLRGTWDLILSNAALQWVPDHPSLLAHLYDCLAPGGQLAVQVPTNHTHPSQTLMSVIAHEEPYASALDGYEKTWSVLDLHGYGALLYRLGFEKPVLIEKLYGHVVENAQSMVTFVQSTAMRPYLERMPESLHASFREELGRRLAAVFPGSPVYFGFKRLFFVGHQPSV